MQSFILDIIYLKDTILTLKFNTLKIVVLVLVSSALKLTQNVPCCLKLFNAYRRFALPKKIY